MATLKQIKQELENENARTAWKKGVIVYAWELIENVEQLLPHYSISEDTNILITDDFLLNGATNWNEYSRGGCSLIYDEDIAKTLCTPSELKKNNNGMRKPNKNEEWLDVQARALRQAAHLIFSIQYKINHRSVK